MLGVKFGGFGGVMHSVVMMAIGNVRVMGGEVMVPRFVVARGFAMMSGGVLMVVRCFAMMLGCFLGHGSSFKGVK